MTKSKFLLCLGIILSVICIVSGCGTPDAPSCAHNYGILRDAIPAGFFHEGSIAHYQCSLCDGYFDSEKTPVDSIITAKKTRELFLCINDQALPLSLSGEEAQQITWTSSTFTAAKGDVITLQDATGGILPFAADGGMLDAAGTLRNSLTDTNAILTVTPQGLTLTIRDNRHPGIVVQVNSIQYPMALTHYRDSGVTTYLRGYLSLSAGDTLWVQDNPQDLSYGFDRLSPLQEWNTRDYHRGTSGELVIDSPGRYLLEFDRGGDKAIRISKVFTPRAHSSFQLVFPGSNLANIPLEAHSLPQDALLAWFVNLDTAENHTDVKTEIAEHGLVAYSAILTPEPGTVFHLETDSGVIAGDHVTEIIGNSQCVHTDKDALEITKAGTYLVSYIPATDSIQIAQLGTGSLWEAADSFDKQIAAIPSGVEADYSCEIRQLYEIYTLLPSSFRSRLEAAPKLKKLYSALTRDSNSSDGIVYHLRTVGGSPLYRSKEDLFQAFYTDFYYYIAACHGTERLRKSNVHSAEDLVVLAKDFDGRDMPNLYAIGYIAGIYFLEYDANGILENQDEDGFLGFCYSNGIHQELLPFLIRFFAYWRIDEGYANSTNPGADLFAEAWAPTVDIAKYFYYDEDTSYVKTPRVLDCFANTAGVVRGFDGADPLPVLQLRDYIFEGWYDNPDYNGEPLTQLPKGDDTCHLYAKWGIDKAQQDADAAALVDVYIHNLDTKVARKNASTVGYVKTMYDALSPEAKAMVTEYETLDNYIKQYLKLP